MGPTSVSDPCVQTDRLPASVLIAVTNTTYYRGSAYSRTISIASLCILTLILAALACSNEPERTVALSEIFAIPVDGSIGGLRSVVDAEVVSDGIVVLDAVSLRALLIDSAGAIVTTRRIRPFSDGTNARTVAALPNGTVLAVSGSSSACAVYDSSLRFIEPCSLPGEFIHVTQAFFVAGHLVVIGLRAASPHVIHVFTEQLEFTGSFGNARSIAEPGHSRRLQWGIGIATRGSGDTILYSEYNPFDIRIF